MQKFTAYVVQSVINDEFVVDYTISFRRDNVTGDFKDALLFNSEKKAKACVRALTPNAERRTTVYDSKGDPITFSHNKQLDLDKASNYAAKLRSEGRNKEADGIVNSVKKAFEHPAPFKVVPVTVSLG